MTAEDFERGGEVAGDALMSGGGRIGTGEFFKLAGGLLAQRERCAGNDLFVYFDHWCVVWCVVSGLTGRPRRCRKNLRRVASTVWFLSTHP